MEDGVGAQPNKNLASASLWGVADTLESISQDIHGATIMAAWEGGGKRTNGILI